MPHLDEALAALRQRSTDPTRLGQSFERLIQAALSRHPGIYGDRFSKVWMWHDWPGRRYADIGIDLVAEEADGGLCAIQCKFFADDRPVPKQAIDSFMSASEPARFTSRLIVNTGGPIQRNALIVLQESAKPCKVLDRGQLAAWDVDWLSFVDNPADLQFAEQDRHRPYPYQRQAIDSVIAGFRKQDRGKLVLPCGTGKTEVALWIAEEMVGVDGRVLYLVPSIALMAQTMRTWAEQKGVPHRYVGICSDTRTGTTDEDVSLLELDFPVTTRLDRITQALSQERRGVMTVVFCTYQSLALVEQAQAEGALAFDLAICDEAHRTTGVEKLDDSHNSVVSPFLLVHDADRIRAAKRLYATATPRLYTEGAKSKAARLERDIFSMDDPSVYGPEFFHMPFAQAVEEGWLSDYRVVLLAMRSEAVADQMVELLAQPQSSGLNLDDAVRLLGCWDALADPEGRLASDNRTGDMHNPMQRAIAFTSRIKQSKLVAKHWNNVVDTVRKQSETEGATDDLLQCQIEHVDGTTNSLDRTRKLQWLSESEEGVCRVLSNARCLTEGVDVPALDAVLFLSTRRSQVDVVQAVGRVMRRAPGKQFGYIILPVVISPGQDPEQALNSDSPFQALWDVVRALRSHDERFDAQVNSLDLNRRRPGPIIILGDSDDRDHGGDEGGIRQPQLPMDLICKIPPGAIYARIVEKCGDRKYWPQWAADVAQIADRIRTRVAGLIRDPERITLQKRFQSFLSDLRLTLNRELQEEDVVSMVAQHLVTGPVFQALFRDYDFVGLNPVARALARLVELLEEQGLENETRDLEPFYASVRRRAQALDNPTARQTVLLELYERFFQTAFPKEAARLGIVYTPVEVVDFILRSADYALQTHFGRRLSEETVHVLDPFTGTGTFLVRLLQHPNLIRDSDLKRKFASELHANEIVLLAYYIAAINIEESYHGRLGMDAAYQPFEGMAFADTFNLSEGKGQFAAALPVNSRRVERQQARDITVIVGNPPYSAGQRSATDDNPNVVYPQMIGRIQETYVARSSTTLQNSLYDSYKLAIRWASDRIGDDEGVIAFVTNGSFIDGNADAGLRACLADEFSHLYVFNLRGNQRTQGERSKQEGGKIFGSGSRTPVAIMVLVRDPAHSGACRIHYKDIGDYLSRAEKLQKIKDFGSIGGILDWQTIQPDVHHDWLDQRDPRYQMFFPLAVPQQKGLPTAQAAFSLFSNGLKTNRDTWVYGFDNRQLMKRMKRMTEFYEHRRRLVARGHLSVSQATRNNAPTDIKWTRGLRNILQRKEKLTVLPRCFRIAMYRPFCKQHVYFNPKYIEVVSKILFMFPTLDAPNQVVAVTGRGSTKDFSSLITAVIPDLELVSKNQCFPRWQYESLSSDSLDAWVWDESADTDTVPGYRRVDNITDWCLTQFREHYASLDIVKDDIWHYLYGLLHAPDYRERYKADLSKDLPRIPFAPDFAVFRDAGASLAALHLGYETGPLYPLDVEVQAVQPDTYQLGQRPMRWGGTRKDLDKSVLQVTPHVTLRDIPDEAHKYVVNGRTPLEWAMDRLHIRQDKESGIINDPNAWFAADPASLVSHLQRLVYLSVETHRIVEGLSPAL